MIPGFLDQKIPKEKQFHNFYEAFIFSLFLKVNLTLLQLNGWEIMATQVETVRYQTPNVFDKFVCSSRLTGGICTFISLSLSFFSLCIKSSERQGHYLAGCQQLSLELKWSVDRNKSNLQHIPKGQMPSSLLVYFPS